MILKVLGSGSSGNCYLLESDSECLVLESGLSLMEVKKALNFNIRKIVGVIAGHCHSDHAGHTKEYEKTGFKVFKPYECEESAEAPIKIGNFTIKAFPLVHDVPCYGFWIHHPEIGKMVYVTDTEYCLMRFKGLNHIICEENYDKSLLGAADENSEKRAHVLTGHMELQTTLDFIQTNDNAGLRNIILCHLSGNNSDGELFLQKTREVTDKEVYIARKGLEISLDLVPF